ncbi:MAG: ATP-binding protein [Leptospirales bacterium]
MTLKIHNILPAVSVTLTVATLGLTYFVRRWSVSTFSLMLVLGTSLLPSFFYFSALRNRDIESLQSNFRMGTSGELLTVLSVYLFSVLYARTTPLAEIKKSAVPLLFIGTGIAISLNEIFFDPDLVRILVIPQTRSVLLINNPTLNTISFLLIGILLFSFFQLSKTYVTATGLDRWHLKYPMIGVFLWSLSLIIVHANQIAGNGFDRSFLLFVHVGLLLMDSFFLYAFLIQKAQEVTLALSRNTINRSLLLLLGGVALVGFGGLGSSLESLGPVWSKVSSSLMVFLGIAAFTVVFASDRLRRELEGFLGLHFYSNRYDYRTAWTSLTQALTDSADIKDLVPTLMEQTREITQSQFLSYSQILDSSRPSISLQETVGWTPSKKSRTIPLDPDINSFLTRGIPLHSSDPELTPKNEIWPMIFKELNANWILPLVLKGRLFGLLGLDTKSSGGKDLFEERLFLQTLALQWVNLLAGATRSREMAWNREADLLSGLRASTFHDLKNAGVALKLLLHNAHRNIDSPDFQKELLYCLQNISQQIDGSMETILSPFRQEYTRISSYRPEELVKTLARALNWTKTEGFSLILDFEEIPEVQGNPKALETTLRNLLINAREAMENKGEIRVKVRPDAAHFILSVSDNGPGMSREFLENHLFRPFQTTKKKGTGLGLFSSKLLIEQSGGTIQVNSKEGEGSEFLISLPMKFHEVSKVSVKISDTSFNF